jgi:hypothetical protein
MMRSRQCLAVGTSSEGVSEETGMKTIKEHLTLAWKTAESNRVTTNPACREAKHETKEECRV